MTPTPRKSRFRGTLVALIALAFLPTVILLVLTYRQAVRRAEVALADNVATANRRATSLLTAADKALSRLRNDATGRSHADTQKQLVRLVYEDLRFREAGLNDPTGRLVLTNFGPVEPPILITESERCRPGENRLQVVGLIKTAIMREKSIIIGVPTEANGSLNVLVEPSALTVYLDDVDLGPQGYLAFVRADGQVLAAAGSPPTADGILQPSDGQWLTAERKTDDGQIRAVGAVLQSWALRGWYDNLAVVGPVALLCNAALIAFTSWLTRRRTGLDHDLRLGIQRGEFEVHYQPVVDLHTGVCVAAEALLRWKHPEQGVIRPDVFIPIAEQSGAIEDLTLWLVRRAGTDLADVFRSLPDFYLTVNLPPVMLTTNTAADVVYVARGAGIPSNRLVFEVTEGGLIEGPVEDVANEMRRLTAQGVRFALDDFGTGYSSLNYLHKFPFHLLKIDRSFLPGEGKGVAIPLILDSLIELGLKLGLKVVAEGVEREDQAAHLKGRAVQLAQGWLYARSMPARDLKEYLARVV